MSQTALTRRSIVGDDKLARFGTATVNEIRTWHERIEAAADSELIQVYQLAGEIGKRAWIIQAHCLSVAKQRKRHHNDGGIRAVAEMFGLSPSQASGLIRIWDTWGDKFLERDAPADRVIGVSWYKTAAYTGDPDGWLAHIERRHQENPAYRVEDLRQEISKQQRQGSDSPPEPTTFSLVSAGAAVVAPAPAPAPEVRQALYRSLIAKLEEAAAGTGDLVYETDPRDMAAILGPISEQDERFVLNMIEGLASWVRRTALARRNLC